MNPSAPVAACLARPGLLCVPNAWDAASARRVLAAGAPFVATTSAAVAWSLGLPDGQAVSPAQLLQRVAEIRRACPQAALSVDIERGYHDSPAEVAAFVDALVQAGVSGINIEDGSDEPARLARKISAIRASQDRANLFINARIDTWLLGLGHPDTRTEDTLARARSYRNAGCDGIFVPCLADPEAIGALVRGVDAPLNLMAVPGLPDVAVLARLGVRRLTAGPGIALASYAHCEHSARAFVQGDLAPVLGAGLAFADMEC